MQIDTHVAVPAKAFKERQPRLDAKESVTARDMQEGNSVWVDTRKKAEVFRQLILRTGHNAAIRIEENGFRVWKGPRR